MSTTTHPATLDSVNELRDFASFRAALHAEWDKLRTLRSTWVTVAIAILAAVVLGALGSLSDARGWDDMTTQEQMSFDPTSTSLIGVLFGALVLGALGVRTITGEYSTGMIRTTAAALPRRSYILWAKAVAVAMLSFMFALGANVAGFAIGQAALRRENIDVSITDPDSVAAIVLGAVAVSCFAVVGLGLGTLVKRATVANIVIALVVIGGQIVGAAIPTASQRYLPFNALQATVTVNRGGDLLHPGTAVAMIAGYTAVAVVAATVVLNRRDV